jgi:hypothetical protein
MQLVTSKEARKGRSHSKYFVWLALQPNATADDAGAGREMAPPERVPDNNNVGRAGNFF